MWLSYLHAGKAFMSEDIAPGRRQNSVDPHTSPGPGPFDEIVDPADLVEPEDALPAITLADLPQEAQAAAATAGWTRLMPVQARAIPYLLAGRDLMVQARTGSGKTGAFLLPILHQIETGKKACQALVLAPTRELALQVSKEAELLGAAAGVRSIAVYGGVGYGPQIEAMPASAFAD